MTNKQSDVIIIGGGPAGSTAATILAQNGHQVKLFEKEIFPRPHVGETLLPFCHSIFEELGVLKQMEDNFSRKPGARFLNLDGSIYSNYCFDKVIKGPEHLSFHVERAQFDKILLDNARDKGAQVKEGVRVSDVSFNSLGVEVDVKENGVTQTHQASFLLDASGQHSFLAKKMKTKQKHKELDRTAFWAHWKNVDLFDGLEEGILQIVFLDGEKKGWIWVIPFKDKEASIGVVVNSNYIKQQKSKLSSQEDWKKAFYLQELNDSSFISKVLAPATLKPQIFVNSDYSYLVSQKYGDRYALIGDAGAFIDPIFSTGVFLAMKSGELVAKALDKKIKGEKGEGLEETYNQINEAYKLVEGMILNYYNPQVPNFHEMNGLFYNHDSAYALLHFLLAGDFFNRHHIYADFLDKLKKPKQFARYKNLIYSRSNLEHLSCEKIEAPGSIGLYWDQLWRQLQSQKESALWDVPPAQAVAEDFQLFESAFSENLPVIDIGCGSGIQTLFLAQKYASVIGIDASKKAIKAAREENKSPQISFEQLNLLEKDQVTPFYQKTGDANIYMRGVVHQIPIKLRPSFLSSLKLLMGQTGALYLIETAPNIQTYIQELANHFSDLPISFKRVLTSHFPPLGVSLTEIHNWFNKNDFDILDSGNSTLKTNIILDNQKTVELPAVYALIKPKFNKQF